MEKSALKLGYFQTLLSVIYFTQSVRPFSMPHHFMIKLYKDPTCMLESGFSGPFNCNCRKKNETRKYEIGCPDWKQPIFRAYLDLDRQNLTIVCDPRTTKKHYNLLIGSHLGQLRDLHFDGCPPPDSPFQEFSKTLLNANITEGLTIRNYPGESLEARHFSGLKRIMSLEMTGNNLTEIPDEWLHEMPNLTKLNLTNNNLKLRKKNFIHLPKLKSLLLEKNNITDLDEAVFEGLKELEYLDIRENGLISLARNVLNITSLKILDISFNPLLIQYDDFISLPKLKAVLMEGIDLTGINQTMLFSENGELQTVKLQEKKLNSRKIQRINYFIR